jgi:ABC-type transport system involved in cytochrome c biogenesis permease component
MKFRTLLVKDLRREIRSKHTIQAGAVMVALFFMVGLFAYNGLAHNPRAAAAMIWTPIIYAAAAMVGRTFGNETDLKTMQWLQSMPFPNSWIGWSRTLVDGIVALALVALSLLLANLMFEIPLSTPLFVLALLSTIGLAIIGSLSAAIATQASAREILLPLLMIPVSAPLLMSGVKGTMQILADPTWASAQTPLLLVAAFDLVALGMASFLWEPLLEDA